MQMGNTTKELFNNAVNHDCLYHGTRTQSALDQIVKGNIDMEIGGGELGQGFYMANYLHKALAWSAHTSEKGLRAPFVATFRKKAKITNLDKNILLYEEKDSRNLWKLVKRNSWERSPLLAKINRNQKIIGVCCTKTNLKVWGEGEIQVKWEGSNAKKRILYSFEIGKFEKK